MTDPLPLSYINQYAYCPRRFWYMYAQSEMEVNAHVLRAAGCTSLTVMCGGAPHVFRVPAEEPSLVDAAPRGRRGAQLEQRVDLRGAAGVVGGGGG